MISNEHFQVLEQKQIQNPQELLDNVISVLNINKNQAIEKLKYLEKNEKPKSFPLSISQNCLAQTHGKYFLSNLPESLFCV